MTVRKSCAAVALLTLTGCSLVQIRRENQRLSAVGEIDGRVLPHVALNPEHPIVVVLLRQDTPTEEVQSSVVLYRPGPYHFWAERGTYSIFAFNDENENLKYDDGEPASFASPHQVRIDTEQTVTDVNVVWSASPVRHVDYQPRHDELVSLDELRIGDAMGKKGMWAPGLFRERNGDDALYLLEPYDPAKLPVVFVHGIGGCPSNMRPLIEGLDRTRFQPWLFWYASGKRFSVSAQSLRRSLDELRVLHPFSTVVVVAQSVGGMVAREAVSMLQDRDHGYSVAALITLSTPWGGHSKASYSMRLSPLVLPAWHDIAPESLFQQHMVSTSIPGVRHYLFFSYGPGTDTDSYDGSVALSSELELNMQRGAAEVMGFPESHMGIITNPDAQRRFMEVLSAVREEVASSLERAPVNLP
jgi:pimeloyl-ACP methyl ester carboxylesterase